MSKLEKWCLYLKIKFLILIVCVFYIFNFNCYAKNNIPQSQIDKTNKETIRVNKIVENNEKTLDKLDKIDPSGKKLNKKQKHLQYKILNDQCINNMAKTNFDKYNACARLAHDFYFKIRKAKKGVNLYDLVLIYLSPICSRVTEYINYNGIPLDSNFRPSYFNQSIVACNKISVIVEKKLISKDLIKQKNREKVINMGYWVACKGGYQPGCDNESRRASKSNEPSL